MHPRLLVSVRSPIEALAAIHGGADVIDVKEPLHGSLGRASLRVAREIAEQIRDSGSAARLSFALGEATEWSGPLHEDQLAWVQFLNDPQSTGLMKLGLAATFASQNSAQPWRSHWNLARRRILNHEVSSSNHHTGTAVGTTERDMGPPAAAASRWIAVAYVDNVRGQAPGLFEVAEAAVAAHCHGLLLDTCVKDGQGLLEWCSQDDLLQVRQLTSRHGLILAVAGQIQTADLPALRPIAPDVIAVRGSVCDRGQRVMSVQTQLVRQLVETIRSVSWNSRPDAR